jgi:predicted nucleic acid-binding protein
LVLAEVQRLLLFRAGGPAASAALDRLESSPALTLLFPSADHHVAARGWLRRLAERRLSYTAAVSFAVMDARRCHDAFTFDQDFAVAGFRA